RKRAAGEEARDHRGSPRFGGCREGSGESRARVGSWSSSARDSTAGQRRSATPEANDAVLGFTVMAHRTLGGKRFTSEKTERFSESVIREMTRQAMVYEAINLAQGFP